MKHKVRDRVRIRPDLRTDIKYGEGEAVDEMYALRGQIVTINEVDTEGGILSYGRRRRLFLLDRRNV